MEPSGVRRAGPGASENDDCRGESERPVGGVHWFGRAREALLPHC